MYDVAKERVRIRKVRCQRIRRKIQGTELIPRLCIRRSLNHFHAQLINDEKGLVITSGSSLVKETKELIKGKSKVEVSYLIGKRLGESAKNQGVSKIVFDRSGYLYHGRVKSFADGVREAGLNF